MTTILHGDDLVSSRKALDALRSSSREREILTLDGPKIGLTDLKQALESPSLFSSSRLVILEGFLSSRPSKEKLAYLGAGQLDANLVFWEKKKISPAAIKKLGPHVKVQLFKTPALVFRFLDSFGSPNPKVSLLLLKNALLFSPPTLVFYLLVKRVRDLLLVKGRQKIAGIQTWQLKKLQNQAQFFRLEDLLRIYRQLLAIDRTQKTSRERFRLEGELEMLILDIDQN